MSCRNAGEVVAGVRDWGEKVVYLKNYIAIVLRDLNGPAFSPALVEVAFLPE